ncbi:MAG: hypothetical protein IKU03_00415 [Bacteroidales bacterium]|nr:hypothetical protein [Bacteroidales bacterium]
MKRIVQALFLIAGFAATLSAQERDTTLSSSTPFRLEPYGGHFEYAGTNQEVDASTLQILLTPDQFRTYQRAHKEFIASIVLWSIAGASVLNALTCLSLSELLYGDIDFSNIGIGVSAYCFVMSMIPAIVLTVDSQRKLHRVANAYNQNLSLRIGGTPNGFGLTLNF